MGIVITRIRELWSPYRRLDTIHSQIKYYNSQEKEVCKCMKRRSKYSCNLTLFCYGIIHIILLVFYDISVEIQFILFSVIILPVLWVSFSLSLKLHYSQQLIRIRGKLYELNKELRTELETAKETFPYNQYVAAEKKYNCEAMFESQRPTVSATNNTQSSLNKEATLIQLDN